MKTIDIKGNRETIVERTDYPPAKVKAIPPSAPNATIRTGGDRHTVKRMNPSSASAKSARVPTALVHTGS